MSSIDSRIVTMKFDNTAFGRGVTSTLDMLNKLKIAVTGMGSTKLSSIDTSKATAGLSEVGRSTDTLGSKFSALGVIAISALATIASKATESALTFAKSFTFGPIMDGLREYELNLQSIQTIQANTDQPLRKINASLDELNRYSDQTIYNFAEMAKNIGTFTAAGVDLKIATSAIKGIANMAALSGSTSQQASTAMYQLSQAISSGRVSLMDWNSVVNAGMGGEKLQNALAQTAVAMGTLNKEAVGTTGAMKTLAINGSSFRNSITAQPGEEPWLNSEVLVNTLASLDGRFSMLALTTEKTETGILRYTKAESKASIETARLALEQKNGVKYTDEQFKSLMALSDSSFLAATQVKTLSQVFAVAKETLASGWAATFKNIFGDFKEAKTTFTALSGTINDGINAMALARNKMLAKWNDMGGRTAMIDGLKNAFQAFYNVLKPIGQAFRDVFPATTAKQLYNATVAFRDFTEGLIASKGTMNNIRSIFGAFFGVLGVGWEIFKGLVRYVASFIGLLAGGTGGVLDFTGSLAEIVEKLTQWILKGDYIANFFDMLINARAKALGPIIEYLSDLLSTLAGIVSSGADVAIEAILWALEAIKPVLSDIRDGLVQAGGAVQTYLIAAFEKLEPVLQKIKDAIADAFGSISGVGAKAGGALGGLAAMFNIGSATDTAKKGIDAVKNALSKAGPAASAAKGELSGFAGFLAGVGGFLVSVGKAIGSVLKQIWDDVSETASGLSNTGILSGIKDFFLGLVESIKNFVSGLSFGEVMAVLNTLIMGAIGGGLGRLLFQFGGFFKSIRGVRDGAAQALRGFGSMYEDLGKAAKSKARATMILNMGIALGILAVSLYILSKIDGPKLASGLAAVAAMLIMMSAAIIILEKSMPDKGALASTLKLAGVAIVMVALAAAMLLMAIALRIIAKLDGDELKKGMITIGVVLAGIIAATVALNKSGGAISILQASIAIGILAFALTAFAGAIKLYSKLDPEMLLNGGLKIALLMAGLGLAMRAFPTGSTIGAAAGLILVAIALRILVPALKELSKISDDDSWKVIKTLAIVLAILAIAMHAMSSATAGGLALLLVAVALKVLVPQLLLMETIDMSNLIKGMAALAIGLVLLGIAGALGGAGILILGAGMLVFGAGLLLAGTGMFLFAAALTALSSAGAASVAIMISVINTFLEAIPGFIQRLGASLIEAAKQVRLAAPAFMRAAGVIMRTFLQQVIKTVPLIGKTFRTIIAEALKTLRAAIPDMVKTGFAILMAFLQGLRKNITAITKTAVSIVVKFIDGIASRMDRIVEAGYNLVVKFVSAVARKIGTEAKKLKDAAWQMAVDMITGMVSGLVDYGLGQISQAVARLAGAIPGPIKKLLGINSPSRVMRELGGYVGEGLALGIDDGTRGVAGSAEGMAKTALDTMKMTMSGISDTLSSNVDFDPTIRPVLDLTKLTQDANKIGGMLANQSVTAGVSLSQASSISADAQATQESMAESRAEAASIVFQQTNNSPKALSAVEIYRQTRNQLSLAKEALNA